ncbi:hypothetical protein [Bacillus infantis]|uniref:hypothetical protein n=1 Tax=Bacillus infantis TaxID=324767 RepID=UPI003CF6DF96
MKEGGFFIKRIGGAILFLLFLLLTGCSNNSVEEALKDKLFHLDVLLEQKTELGYAVFYKTKKPEMAYGARLLEKEGMNWKVSLGSEIQPIQDEKDLVWGWQSDNNIVFVYGVIKNPKIEQVTINGNDASVQSIKGDYNVFFLVTDKSFEIDEDITKIEVKGLSKDGAILYYD